MKKSLIQKLGLLGIVSFLSYTAAVVFAPLAYPGYHWMAQAVSDLSAANAPSLALWNQLSALYNVCEVVCAIVVCIGIQGQKTKLLRSGIYLFAIMEWISAVGYRMFPLSDSGYAGAFQDVMHMAVTALVVLLSIVSLVIIIVAGVKSKSCRSYGVCRCRIGHDACGCGGDENRPCRIFRRGRALQRVCGYGLQRGAGYPPVLYEERNINAAGYMRKKRTARGQFFFSLISAGRASSARPPGAAAPRSCRQWR